MGVGRQPARERSEGRQSCRQSRPIGADGSVVAFDEPCTQHGLQTAAFRAPLWDGICTRRNQYLTSCNVMMDRSKKLWIIWVLTAGFAHVHTAWTPDTGGQPAWRQRPTLASVRLLAQVHGKGWCGSAISGNAFLAAVLRFLPHDSPDAAACRSSAGLRIDSGELRSRFGRSTNHSFCKPNRPDFIGM